VIKINVRKYLEQHGLTQAELASRLEVDTRTVRRWCAKDEPAPRLVDYALRWMTQNGGGK
jgi:transcriptional regulator with XRE-family HTH domain